MTSACWVLTARITICCWPLRVVAGPPEGGGRVRVRGAGVGGRRREQRADDQRALEQRLDARPVDAGDDRDRSRRSGLTVTTGNLSAVRPDDHVHVVASLGERADARDLVNLDRDGQKACGALERSRRWAPPVDGSAEMSWPLGRDRLAAILPTTERRSREAPGRLPSSGSSVLRGQVVGLDLGWTSAISALQRSRSDRSRRLGVLRSACSEQDDDKDERDDGEEDPDKQDQTIRALQVCISPTDTWVLRVTGGNTLAPRFRPDISQKGLVPLGGSVQSRRTS